MADAAVARPGRLARFDLLREIGHGTQARVWLAHDPRLDREVAIKLLTLGGDTQALAASLSEARAVSRLSHPNIVPVFEADEHQGQPYLVFEYVEGPTLAQSLRKQPVREAAEAVALMLGVLDALEAAHEQGVVHRDLKPSNVLLGTDGRPRVMDFGIAARCVPGQAGAAGRVIGTPGYLSPEAARGAAPVPAMDVFSAGALLGEMLCGRPLLQEADPARAVARVQTEDLLLPAAPAVDGGLRSIVQRALARDPALRYDSARAMHIDLQAWLNPETATAAVASAGHATLEFLLRRMRHRTDFPALSNAVARIQRVATSETESIRALTEEILQDVALTHKLLRLVNTAHYSAVSQGGVGTVSRAVALVGFSGIRNMALSLVLLEHMPDKAHATQLKFEFVRALMVGMLASELAPKGPSGEEAFLGALFQNLGRLLTEYYLPEEALQIRQHLGSDTATPAVREAAAQRVLGIGFDELGGGVARAWGLPESLQRVLRSPVGELPVKDGERAALLGVERLRWLGRSANALVDALQAGPADPQACHRAAEIHAPVLGVPVATVMAATDTARQRLIEAVQVLGLVLPPGSAARRLIEPPAPPRAAPSAHGNVLADAHADANASAEQTASNDAVQWGLTAPMPLPEPAQEVLEKALVAAQDALAERSMDVSELLHLVLDTLHRALNLRNVVLCLREPGQGGRLVGRLGLGPGGGELSTAFRFTPDAAATNDIFALLCARGADLLVADASKVVARLPGWYRRGIDAPTFLLLPLMVKGRAIGLIYADKARTGSLVLGDKELTLVRALRDQVTLAFGRTG
jgi:serine/threonine protein kinase